MRAGVYSPNPAPPAGCHRRASPPPPKRALPPHQHGLAPGQLPPPPPPPPPPLRERHRGTVRIKCSNVKWAIWERRKYKRSSDARRLGMSSTCGNGYIAVAELHAIGLNISTHLISDTNPHFTVSLFPTIGGLRWLSEEQQSQAPKCCSGFKSTAEAMDSRLPFPFPPDAK